MFSFIIANEKFQKGLDRLIFVLSFQTTLEYLSFAAVSKIIAACVTYPYQVLRSRLQDQHVSYSGVIDVVQKILK